MYLPRQQIAQLYTDLIRTNHHGSAPIVILTALTVDSLCAAHILDLLLKRDFVRHQLVPIAGYSDLQKAGIQQVQTLSLARGGTGGTVVCLGLGGAVALEEVLGLDGAEEDGAAEDHGVEVWVLDSHRPLNLENVFGTSAASQAGDLARRSGVKEGRVLPGYKSGRGGVIVFDDGDLEEELRAEKEAFFALQDMPEITEDDLALNDEDGGDEGDEDAANHSDDDGRDEDTSSSGQKRKRATSSDGSEDEDDSEGELGRARRRRRSNTSSSIPIPSSPGGNPFSAQLDGSTPPPLASSPPRRKEKSAKQLRRELLKLRRKHEATLDRYYDLGTKAAECVSSMLYSLASDLGREDNELLWLAIVGINSTFTSASGPGARASQIKAVLQDEVRRLNPIPEGELQRTQSVEAIIPTTARSPTDTGIRLSPEPRFLMIRHWSLYDSMLHSPYLATRLHVWSEPGKKRLHKLLAKMGISLQEAGKGYLHMDSELKRTLRKRILKFAEQYNLDGLVPTDKGRGDMDGWGFVRSWGWRGTLSAEDVAIVIGAILEVGGEHDLLPSLTLGASRPGHSDANYNERVQNLPTPPHSSDDGHGEIENSGASDIPDYVEMRFARAMAALRPGGKGLSIVMANIPAAQNLYKAILRVGSALVNKAQIRHLRAYRMAVVREGPDTPLFTHPGALVRLAGWVGEAIAVLEGESGKRSGKDEALVLAALDEGRGVYVVVGLGGGTGWNSSGKKIRSKAEIKEREDAKKRRSAERAARKAAEKRKREEQRRLRAERNAANGMLDDDEEEEESEPETEEDEDEDENDSDDEVETGGKVKKIRGLNRFGQAFQEVVEETGSRVRIDSFEHSVVEVKKDDLAGFLEVLSSKVVVA